MNSEAGAISSAEQSRIECRYRITAGNQSDATCGFVTELIGLPSAVAPTVDLSTCRACLRSPATSNRVNPVQASCAYRMFNAIIASGGDADCSVARARHLRSQMEASLTLLLDDAHERLSPPAPVRDSHTEVGARHISNREESPVGNWMIGLMTAPRPISTIENSVASLTRSGFRNIHVFAEPEAVLPDRSQFASVTVNHRKLGSVANFICGLAALHKADPDADAYAMFQDDVSVAAGLRAWCDQEFWPQGHGLVSLFTPRIHADDQRGWRILQPGGPRIHGGQAFVFRRDVLEQFLNDSEIAERCRRRGRGCDRVVCEWAARHTGGIAYHTPSLIGHVGSASSIDARGPDPLNFADSIADTTQIGQWRPPPRRRGRIVLVGGDAATGLGSVNRDLARHLSVDRWIVPRRANQAQARAPRSTDCEVHQLAFSQFRSELPHLFEGMEWLLFVETPLHRDVIHIARSHGLRIACVPMWERLSPRTEWLGCVDMMICPTRAAGAHYRDWKRRYGFGYDVMDVRWPIDVQRFEFRRRERCDRFLFVNGCGGDIGRRMDGSQLIGGRKGLDVVLEAAHRVPEIPVDLYSQIPISTNLPSNVRFRSSVQSNVDLYREGDVCIQPSRWEGIGLQLLECQAAGLPLITTNAAPMDEFEPLAAIRVRAREAISLEHAQPVLAHTACPEHLAELMRSVWKSDLSSASDKARQFIERNHNWVRAASRLRELFVLR